MKPIRLRRGGAARATPTRVKSPRYTTWIAYQTGESRLYQGRRANKPT
jgi:hypothetical protein